MRKLAIYTEKQANTLWCPFSRAPHRTRTMAINREHNGTTTVACFCVASKCMAWRWAATHINDPHDPKADLIPAADVYGYCGLSGSPEGA